MGIPERYSKGCLRRIWCFLICVALCLLVQISGLIADEEPPSPPKMLQQYLSAQMKFRKDNLSSLNGGGEKQYASRIGHLAGKNAYKDKDNAAINFIDSAMADATKENGQYGYYFVDIKLINGNPVDYRYQFAVCAVPCEYTNTTRLTYYIDERGTVLERDTKGVPVADMSEINEGWKPASIAKKKSGADKDKSDKNKIVNPSQLDLAFPTPEELVQAFANAFNALDTERLTGLFKRDADPSDWIREIKDAQKAKQQPLLAIEVKEKRENGNLVSVETAVSVKEGERYQFKDHKWIFEAEKTEQGYKLIKVRSKTVEEINSQLREAEALSERLIKADQNQAWKDLTDLFDFTPQQRIDIAKGDKGAFEKANLGWLFLAVSDTKLQLKNSRTHRKGNPASKETDVVKTFDTVTADGATTDSQELVLLQKRDRAGKNRFFFRPLTKEETNAAISKEIYDIWSAADRATCFAILHLAFVPAKNPRIPANLPKDVDPKLLENIRNSQKEKQATWSGLLLGETKSKLSAVTVPQDRLHSLLTEGDYLFPLWDGEKGLEIVSGYYSIPQLTGDNKESIKTALVGWHAAAPADRPAFLAGLLSEVRLASIHADVIHQLGDLKYFDQAFSPEQVAFWKSYIENQAIPDSAKNRALDALAKKNMESCKEVFLAALTDAKLFVIAAKAYSQADRDGFRSLMVAWLDDPLKRDAALRSYQFQKENREFDEKASTVFTPAEAQNIRAYLPYLFRCEVGKEKIRAVLATQQDPRPLFDVLARLIRNRTEGYGDDIRKLIQRLETLDVQGKDHVIAQSLAYLCAIQDAEGIKLAESYLSGLTDEGKRQIAVMAMISASRKPFPLPDHGRLPGMDKVVEVRAEYARISMRNGAISI